MKTIRIKHNNGDVTLELDEHTESNANILTVRAASNCPQGGDSGHGGRTYLCLEDEASTDLNVCVDGKAWKAAHKIEIMLGGDTENETLRGCLEAALAMLGGPYVRPKFEPTEQELEAERAKAEERALVEIRPALSRAEHMALGRDLFAIRGHLAVLRELYKLADAEGTPPQMKWVRDAFHNLSHALTVAANGAISEAIDCYCLEFAARCYVRDGVNVGKLAGPLMRELGAAGCDFGSVVALELKMLKSKGKLLKVLREIMDAENKHGTND